MKWLILGILIVVGFRNGYCQVAEHEQTDSFIFSLDSINTARQRHQDWLSSLLFESKVARLLDSAFTQLHKPYAYGGKGPDRYDCSGFTGYVYRQLGIRLPASSALQVSVGAPVAKDELRPGDLVFFKGRANHVDRIGHVGIVVKISEAAIEFIHSSVSRGIIVDNLLESAYYKSRYMTARRVLE